MRWATITATATLCLTGALASVGKIDGGLHVRFASDSKAALFGRQAVDNLCGPDNDNAKCSGQRCCSMYGYC